MIFDTIIARARGFLLDPVESFRTARSDTFGDLLLYFAAFLLLHAVLAVIVSLAGISVMGMLGSVMPGVIIPVAVFFGVLIAGTVLTILFSLWVHLIVWIAGGRKGILETTKAVIYGMTPHLLLGWLPFFGFIFSLWSIVLEIIGIREMQEMSSGRALLVMIIAVMVPLIILILLAMYLFINVASASATPAAPYNAHYPIFD